MMPPPVNCHVCATIEIWHTNASVRIMPTKLYIYICPTSWHLKIGSWKSAILEPFRVCEKIFVFWNFCNNSIFSSVSSWINRKNNNNLLINWNKLPFICWIIKYWCVFVEKNSKKNRNGKRKKLKKCVKTRSVHMKSVFLYFSFGSVHTFFFVMTALLDISFYLWTKFFFLIFNTTYDDWVFRSEWTKSWKDKTHGEWFFFFIFSVVIDFFFSFITIKRKSWTRLSILIEI